MSTHIIQIRGANGCGKSTIVRDFIEKGDFCQYRVFLGNKQYEYQFDGKTAIIGNYCARECGGVDGMISDSRTLKNLIAKICRTVKPETLVFEGIMYGITFQFSYDIHNMAKAIGGSYTAICLEPPLEYAIQKVYERNGDKDYNVKALEDKYRSSIKGNAKLRSKGVEIITINTEKIEKKSMWRLLECPNQFKEESKNL